MKKILYLWPVLFLALLFSQCEKAETLLDEEDQQEQPVYPVACFTAPDDVFVGVAVSFSASCSEDAEGYSWDFGDGSTGSGASVSHTYQNAGDYEVTLTVTNGDQTDETSATVTAVREDVVYVNSSITEDATWVKDVFYVVTRTVSVDAALTIQPGTVVKFKEEVNMNCADGRIIAQGTAQAPIIFTSFRDDAHDDTNGDGSATTPGAGDWGHITISGTNNTSVFDHCHFYYGGGYYDYDHTLELISSGTSVTNCTFVSNNGEDLGVVDAGWAEENVAITGNIFYNNVRPMSINGYVDLDGSNIFHNPDDATQANQENAVFYRGNYGEISGARSWGETEVPVVVAYDVKIKEGHSLTIGPGVVVKFMNDNGMQANGGLLTALGTAGEPIIFTSVHDDNWGGDTDNNGDQTGPMVGDWSNISITGTNNQSKLEYCHFYYGGGYYDYVFTLELTSGNTVVDHCTFAYNKGDNLYGALNAKDAEAGTRITNNTFYSNIVPLSINGKLDIDDSNVFHNPANPGETNTRNGIYVSGNFGDIEGNRTWEETEVAFAFPGGLYSLFIDVNHSLTLGDNVVLKFGPDKQLRHHNNLFNYSGSGVYFTSLRDDSKKGDTNGDGSGTTAAAGDWDGVYDDMNGQFDAWGNILYSAN